MPSSKTRLPEADVRHYRDEGFLVLHKVFTPQEIDDLAAEAERLFTRTDLMDTNNIRCRWQNHFETGECRFDCFDPVIDIGPVCARIARDPRLMEAIGDLYGEPACLFKDKLIFKPPGSTGYALHQDYISWKSFPKTFLTVIVAIDSAGAANGATEVFPRCHTRGNLSTNDGDYHQLPDSAVDLSTGVSLDLEPGDVGVFSGFTPHRSGANKSGQWRRLLYLSYNALSDGGEQRDQHYVEFKKWLQERYAEHGKTNTFFR